LRNKDNPGIGRQLAVKHRDHRIAQRILTRIDHCHAASREAWMLLEQVTCLGYQLPVEPTGKITGLGR
jgi:hypothetical protein